MRKEVGADVSLLTSAEFTANMLPEFDALAFGCQAMGSEVLEESEFEPMFTECEPGLGSKKIALFGSYGWGDGQWMRDWAERCRNAGALLLDFVNSFLQWTSWQPPQKFETVQTRYVADYEQWWRNGGVFVNE